uniref:Uncharacterized protein n=1 Tax=Nelumbo nucifera TaxID=4432 RepID=A0A822Z9Y4_NELNU|nr:TPA_asm: hypothetical protein HUJ06_008979 [Nelumbo nucifera]
MVNLLKSEPLEALAPPWVGIFPFPVDLSTCGQCRFLHFLHSKQGSPRYVVAFRDTINPLPSLNPSNKISVWTSTSSIMNFTLRLYLSNSDCNGRCPRHSYCHWRCECMDCRSFVGICCVYVGWKEHGQDRHFS